MEDAEILDTFKKCKSRWEIENDKDNNFMNYPNWVKEMSDPLARIVNSLLSEFDYYSHQVVNQKLKMLHQELGKTSNESFENTIYCVLENKDGRINSGYEYLLEYKYLNSLSKYVVYPHLNELSEVIWSNVRNIVFVDDFCGTGKTFTDYIEKFKDRVKGKHIYYLVVHIMQRAVARIKEYGERNNLNIHIIYYTCTPKAFERDAKLVDKKTEFKKLSIEYGVSPKNVLGYNNTEALVAFYNNTPNNTLEIFWQDTDKNKALFPRENDEMPGWMRMKEEKKARNKSNYLKGCNNGRVY